MLVLVFDNPESMFNVWFSDENYINLNIFINRQVTRVLGFLGPDLVVWKPQHSERVTTSYLMLARGILGPNFGEDDNGNLVIVNQIHYRENSSYLFQRDFKRICHARNVVFGSQRFQQDGATCHTTINTSDWLREIFGNHLIPRRIECSYPLPSGVCICGMLNENISWEHRPSAIAEPGKR